MRDGEGHAGIGGTASLDKLVLLCSHHHTVVHHTPRRVAIDPAADNPSGHPRPPPLAA